jgi:hypothetical protein
LLCRRIAQFKLFYLINDIQLSGNGPSAISLSFLLSGHAPYYVGGADDDHLHRRLTAASEATVGDTLLMQDLEELATVRKTQHNTHHI